MRTSTKDKVQDKPQIENPIIFLGKGSYEMMKNKKSRKGLFWTIAENKYWLMEVKSSSVKESNFDSYAELAVYSTKKFPGSRLIT